MLVVYEFRFATACDELICLEVKAPALSDDFSRRNFAAMMSAYVQ